MDFRCKMRLAFLASFILLVNAQEPVQRIRQEVPLMGRVTLNCASEDRTPVFWRVPPRNKIERSASLSVRMDHSSKYGSYDCYLEPTGGQAVLGKIVELSRPVANINVDDAIVFVTLNKPYTIVCPVDFGPQNTKWLSFDKKKKAWTEHPTITTSTYQIASIKKKDVTVWRCESANASPINGKMEATLVLTEGFSKEPKSTVNAESEIEAEMHLVRDNEEKHTLECEPINGRNGEQIIWEFKGNARTQSDAVNEGYVPIGRDDSTSNVVKLSADDFSLLEVNNCQTKNSGFYRCKLSDGSKRYARMQIKRPEPEIHNFGKQGVQKVENPVGEALNLHCFLDQKSVKARDLVWVFRPKGSEMDTSTDVEYRAGEPARNGIQVATLGDRSRLLFSRVQNTHEGRYFCKYGDLNDYTDLIVKGKRGSGQLRTRGDFDVQLTITRSFSALSLRCSVTINGVPELPSKYQFTFFEDVDGTEKSVNPTRVPLFANNDRNYFCKALNKANKKIVPSALNKVPGVTVTLTSESLTGLRVGTPLKLRCVASDPTIKDRMLALEFNNGRSNFPETSSVVEGAVNFTQPLAQKRHSGNYQCSLSRGAVKSNVVKIVVCDTTELLCRDMSLCYAQNKKCDGNMDCADGSDEERNQCMDCEPHSLKCQTYNGVEPEMKCVLKHWICDGQNDCGNDWDEFIGNGYCNKHPIPAQNCIGCGRNESCCGDGKCFPRAFECDNENDCADRLDETTCTCGETSQLELDNPLAEVIMSVTAGNTVELTCQVRGKERPTINWRFNWGHLPDESRMIESMTIEQVVPEGAIGAAEMYTVKGKLVISNLNAKTDLGRYTCEAVTKCKRRLVPDYIVRLETATTPPF